MALRNLLQKIFPSRNSEESHETALRSFRLQYTHFKDLLRSNAELGLLMADIDEKLHGSALFAMSEVRSLATRCVFHAMSMVSALNAIAANRYTILQDSVEHINSRITDILESRPTPSCSKLTLPLDELDLAQLDLVGGKCANLGEIRNRANMPVPDGFAITTTTFNQFLNLPELREQILKLLREVNIEAPASIVLASENIVAAIAAYPVPDEIIEALHQAWDTAFANSDRVRAALRSSALNEDGALSFSGQYKTVLGITRKDLPTAFRDVLASLFSPRAITYRLHHGIPFEQCAMGMACIEMVEPVSSGIIFSRHPVDPHSESMVLNAVWGLGEYAVDGIVEPDTWHILREDPAVITQSSVGDKMVRLVLDTDGKHEEPVPLSDRHRPCLDQDTVTELARIALHLEAHYHYPQDVEWALDKQGRIIILQSRPMRIASAEQDRKKTPPVEGAHLLIDQADAACSGIGYGPVIHAGNVADLADFPSGAILVAAHSSPNYVLVMNKAAAIITEAGSITGHMASLAREFHIPTVMNARRATELLQAGQHVTVDAFAGRIYAGEVEELIALQAKRKVTIADTPVHAALRLIADQIIPLHLLDPKSSMFRPESCTTLHDVMRFVHERCYTEMFRISDRASEAGSVSKMLKVKLPIDLHIIDLGGGMHDVDGPYVYQDQIGSVPLNALLAGMLVPDVHIKGPRPINMSGFLSVMNQHMLESPTAQAQRFGERSYCIISDKYLNFSSRVGYHYCVIDAYCGETVNKNYITFQFKGGAADEVRRERRVRCIALILERLGFTTEVRGDMTQARFQKFHQNETSQRLDQLGRLLIMTRQMDMLMVNEQAILTMADNFMSGKYH